VNPEQWTEQVRAIADEVLAGVGNVAIYGNDSGPWAVGIDLISDMGEVLERGIVSARGEVLKPALAARLGLSAQMEELARRLGALGIPLEDTETPEEKEVRAIAREVQPKDTPLPEGQAALVTETLEVLRTGLARGAKSLPVLIESSCSHSGWTDLEDSSVLPKMLKEFSQDVRKRLEEEKHWPEVIEVDRLEAAFADLLSAGIATHVGQGFTLTLGWESIRHEADKLRERGLEPWGAAFCHEQDIDSALEGRPLYIAFGELSDEPSEKDARVGQAVVEALRKHGFEPKWNGHATTRIALHPAFTWRRRRSRVDTTENLGMGDFPAELVELLPQLRTIRMRATGLYLYDLAEMRSDSAEQLTLAYDDEDDARDALPDVTALVKKRFPRLQTLVVTDDRSFEETVDFSE
jgi:hypothetical protein